VTESGYRVLGRSGLVVSTIGLGCNNFGRPGTAAYTREGTAAVIDAALDAGVTLFDTADLYGEGHGLSETLMGECLQGRREQVVIATKFGSPVDGLNGPDWGVRGSRRYVRLAVEGSLRRLRTDWIDLYQLHAPDPVTPIEETLDVLDDLISEGKVRYIGHSNLTGWQIADAEYQAVLHGHPRFVSAQNEYNLLTRGVEREVLPAVRHYGLGFLPYFPLQVGLLTGKFRRDSRPAGTRIMNERHDILDRAPWDRLEEYRAYCDAHGVTMVEATFAWLLGQPGVTSVIAGASRPEQIRENVAAGAAWRPSATELDEISALFAAFV
jgi:aryl-alcohol dehydrogenase-like predicted oxidoreductase